MPNTQHVTIQALATQVLELDLYLFGYARIAFLATFGWPADEALPVPHDSFELRCAIQDAAKAFEAAL